MENKNLEKFRSIHIELIQKQVQLADKELELSNLDNLKKLLFTMIENIPAERAICECANTKKNSQL